MADNPNTPIPAVNEPVGYIDEYALKDLAAKRGTHRRIYWKSTGRDVALYTATPAAAQPDTVAVPRELLTELRKFTLEYDSGRAGILRGNIDALLRGGAK